MLVSKFAESDSFAIVGGAKQRNFAMAQSASAAQILSDALYTNKPRAVVREVLCNATDAHTVAGKKDVPVEITISATEFAVRDFGPGIPDESMEKIYCTYFASTKEKDGAQTGGFGLGSKAPFAYTDHFTVTSFHNGIRSIYAVHKGSEETDGMPGLTLMNKGPCGDETGLLVSVPLEEPVHQHTFLSMVRTVALEGGILVNINKEPLKILDFGPLREKGYAITLDRRYDQHFVKQMGYEGGIETRGRITLLYANVMYPIDTHPDLQATMDLIERFVPRAYRVIVSAKPDTICVTPSRESLSYNPMTLETIKKLLNRLRHELQQHEGRARKELMAQYLSKVSRTNYDIHPTIKTVNEYDYRYKMPTNAPRILYGVQDIVKQWAQVHSGDLLDEHTRFKALSRYFRDNRKSFINLCVRTDWRRRSWQPYGKHSENMEYFRRKLVRAVPADLWKNLYYRSVKGGGLTAIGRSRSKNSDPKWLTPKLVIAPSRYEASEVDDHCFYLVSTSIKGDLAKQIENKARTLGFEVQIIEREKVEEVDVVENTAFMSLKDAALHFPRTGRNARYADAVGYLFPETPTLDAPKYYLRFDPISTRGTKRKPGLKGFRFASVHHAGLKKFFKDKLNETAIIVGPKEEKRAIAAGAKHLGESILDDIQKQLIASGPYDRLYAAAIHLFEVGSGAYWRNTNVRQVREYSVKNRLFFHACLGLPIDRDKAHEQAWNRFKHIFSMMEYVRIEEAQWHIRRVSDADTSSKDGELKEIKSYEHRIKEMVFKFIEEDKIASLFMNDQHALDRHLSHMNILVRMGISGGYAEAETQEQVDDVIFMLQKARERHEANEVRKKEEAAKLAAKLAREEEEAVLKAYRPMTPIEKLPLPRWKSIVPYSVPAEWFATLTAV